MTRKEAASLTSNLLKRGTRSGGHGFVIARPGEATTTSSEEPASGEATGEYDEKGDPVSTLVQGVVRTYNEAFPAASARGEPVAPTRSLSPGHPETVPSEDDLASTPPSAPNQPDLEPARGSNPEKLGDGSLSALARRIETIVQRAIEPKDEILAEPDDEGRSAVSSEPREVSSEEGADEVVQPGSSAPNDEAQAVIESLRVGNRNAAFRRFGRLTGLSADQVEQVLFREDSVTLAVACRSIDMEQLQFVSLYLMVRTTSDNAEAADTAAFKRAMKAFAEMGLEEAGDALEVWRCDMER